ncbi:DNA-binding transcriptional regulator, MarR family [Amphritea atlantica]|uniref:DNA-binding transcriptional regulator, MarR family n=1 Tax=Amphritea atlantica TaxID=355243 RepID=A0A1H9KQW8_9GAMM|nr:winged helix DNA-binding protein [Amphritea atlantica]SER01449.1 DNA-binding transcriptional regulator, MarR family [Amphritea atlantica]
MNDKHATQDTKEQHLDLSHYFPYQLATLDTAVSQSISQLYSGRFNLNRQEWRIMAALGNTNAMSAKEIAAHCNLEKMQVSRTISRLRDSELIHQQEDHDDRRYTRLSLTEKGRGIYKKLVPLILAREAFILSALSDEELHQLLGLMEKIRHKALELQQWG